MTAKARLCALAAVLMCSALYGDRANASAPQQKSQAPGYYRIMPGKFDLMR